MMVLEWLISETEVKGLPSQKRFVIIHRSLIKHIMEMKNILTFSMSLKKALIKAIYINPQRHSKQKSELL